MGGETKRNDTIDAFRAFAILAVLAFHYTVRWTPPLADHDLYRYDHVFSKYFQLGQFGVHIFFVISGLVIAMTVTKSASAWDFAVRRFARLYPAFVVATLLVFIVTRVAGVADFRTGLTDLVATLTMDARDLHRAYVDGAYWSLSVEVKFYGYVALAYLALQQRFWIGVIGLAAVGSLVALIRPEVADRIFIAAYMPFFLVGMAAWLLIFAGRRREAGLCLVFGLIFYVANCQRLIDGVVDIPAGLIHAAIWGPIALMIAAIYLGGTVQLGGVALIGRASYSWYLVHQRIGVIIIHRLRAGGHVPDLAAIVIALLVTLGIACAMHVWVEKPAQAWILRRFHKGRANQLSMQPGSA